MLHPSMHSIQSGSYHITVDIVHASTVQLRRYTYLSEQSMWYEAKQQKL